MPLHSGCNFVVTIAGSQYKFQFDSKFVGLIKPGSICVVNGAKINLQVRYTLEVIVQVDLTLVTNWHSRSAPTASPSRRWFHQQPRLRLRLWLIHQTDFIRIDVNGLLTREKSIILRKTSTNQVPRAVSANVMQMWLLDLPLSYMAPTWCLRGNRRKNKWHLTGRSCLWLILYGILIMENWKWCATFV